MAIGLTQTQLAAPMTRAFVSAVEKGQALPSLGTLWLWAARLEVAVGDLVDGVNGIEPSLYTQPDGSRTSQAGHRDRHDSPSHADRR